MPERVRDSGGEGAAAVVDGERKTPKSQGAVKAKANGEHQEALRSRSQQSSRESAGLTSLGALLRAKLDSSEK